MSCGGDVAPDRSAKLRRYKNYVILVRATGSDLNTTKNSAENDDGEYSQLLNAKVEEIKVNTRLRSTNEENIQEIAESISEIGLINPILVDSDLNLIAGFHRLEAHKFLGRKFIPAIVSTQKELKARLQEVDENLKRAELTAIEKSAHIEERESILRQLDKISIKGDNRYSSTGKSTQSQRAKEIGMSRRYYQYHKELENLHPEVKDLLSDTVYASKLMDLVMLARENDDLQLKVANSLITGRTSNIKRAIVIEKTKANRITSPYVEGLPNFKERYGEMPRSIMYMRRPADEGFKTLWDLAANNDDLRKPKWVTLYGTISIKNYSWNPNHCAFLLDYYTRPGDTILDPFVGRGSTAIAALMLRRNFIGIDILPDVVEHNRQVLGDFVDVPDVNCEFRCEDAIALTSLAKDRMTIDGVIADPPYFAKAEVYSDNPQDLSNLNREEYLKRLSIHFQNLKQLVKPSTIGRSKRIHPVIFKVGSYRRGKTGLVDMALDFQTVAESCGWVLWDKTFTALNSAIQSLSFQRNYTLGYVSKNYETILVFVWFENQE